MLLILPNCQSIHCVFPKCKYFFRMGTTTVWSQSWRTRRCFRRPLRVMPVTPWLTKSHPDPSLHCPCRTCSGTLTKTCSLRNLWHRVLGTCEHHPHHLLSTSTSRVRNWTWSRTLWWRWDIGNAFWPKFMDATILKLRIFQPQDPSGIYVEVQDDNGQEVEVCFNSYDL